jgi:hypothetical protein
MKSKRIHKPQYVLESIFFILYLIPMLFVWKRRYEVLISYFSEKHRRIVYSFVYGYERKKWYNGYVIGYDKYLSDNPHCGAILNFVDKDKYFDQLLDVVINKEEEETEIWMKGMPGPEDVKKLIGLHRG